MVDPVDDFDENNPASHPELLDLLGQRFAENDFDVKYLIRAITASNTYQLTSRQTHESQADARLFAKMAVKGLTPEQLFDSLATATGFYENVSARNRFNIGNNSPRAKIRELFSGETGSAADTRTSILQALALMNGPFVDNATSTDRSTTFAAIVDSPFFETPDRIETLYLAALGRPPRPEERSRLMEFVESAEDEKATQLALGDIFWALLNSSEFILNH